MERLIHSLKVAWRAERLLRKSELNLSIQKVQLGAASAMVGLFGLFMLNLSLFFELSPSWGEAGAALMLAAIDLSLATLFALRARALKPAAETEMVEEVRDMALADIQREISLANAELTEFKKEVEGFVHNPIESLLPGVIGPLLSGVAKGLKAKDTPS